MSAKTKKTDKGATPSQTEGASPATEEVKQNPVKYSMSRGFVAILARLNTSILFSSYQSGKLYLLGRNPKGGLMIDERFFQQAMGICSKGEDLYLAALFQIHRMRNVLTKGNLANNIYDACYIPRASYTVGALDIHDIGVTNNNDIIFVNTRFNCLAKLSEKNSFEPIWKPNFVSKIVDEDRCHLNGMAMENGVPRYVTAVSKSDTIDGWRDRRANGGVVIDVQTNEIVCENLSMPHSPRLHNGRLWVLNSGEGALGYVDLETKTFQKVAFCPGFLRGVTFVGKYAFVGLSKPRYERFEGLALDGKLKETDSEAWCGIQVIDTETGSCAEWFRIDGAVSEIYDVASLTEVVCPMALGFLSNEIKGFITQDEINETFLISLQ